MGIFNSLDTSHQHLANHHFDRIKDKPNHIKEIIVDNIQSQNYVSCISIIIKHTPLGRKIIVTEETIMNVDEEEHSSKTRIRDID